ncbi:hypothetical protein XSR1_160032 [Xenorhabdus szentirmaii DSM 16338]|uniref:Uncharacterized protein n=1 Tax=Xenorhabdus szentirmaii DSM 16338 TaxID=1427518 RepID=W1IW13_9GAMM|nr:hypothetical protein XSR1_160032 [Xenorhabdus szentirmaii DSM 16338]
MVSCMNSIDFRNLKLKSEPSVFKTIPHLIIWLAIIALTLGLGAFVFPY